MGHGTLSVKVLVNFSFENRASYSCNHKIILRGVKCSDLDVELSSQCW